MFIPVGTDRPPKHPPIVAPLLIGFCIAVAMMNHLGAVSGPEGQSLVEWGALDPLNFRLVQLITSAFLHDPTSIWHLTFNMVFLWVFGCSVEGRLGSMWFALFYLGGAIVSGLAHMAVSNDACIGASGAIAACTGAFLAFFPRGHVRVLSLLWFGVFQVSSVWFIGLYICLDVVHQLSEWTGSGRGDVAYAAHLGGYAFGFGLAMILLGFRLLPRDDYDAFFLFKQFRRRAALRAANRVQATSVWTSASADTSERLAKQAAKVPKERPEILELRSKIGDAFERQDIASAAVSYLELAKIDGNPVLGEGRQLEIANQLAAAGNWAGAVRAFEAMLKAYPGSGHRDEVMLLLAMAWVRKIPDPAKAKAMLEQVRPRLHDQQQQTFAEQLQAELEA